MKVKIIWSKKRKKTISAREVDDVIHLYLPMGLSRWEEYKNVQWAKRRFESHHRKKKLEKENAGEKLEQLARRFNKKYFKGELSWERICYSTEQNSTMFGNCNITDGVIRISDRLLKMPKFVHDYVVIHELAHLKVAGHNKGFWELVNGYPRAERARGYLMGVGMGD